MRPITKTAVAAGVAAVIWIGIHNMPSAKPEHEKHPEPSPSPSATPGPTEPAMTAALSTPWQSPAMPLLWPSPPPPPTEEQVRELVRKEMDEAYKRGQEEERRRAERDAIAPVPPNPWETEEERGAKARKYGFVLPDKDGQEWGRIHRTDGEDIARGLLPETTAIETKARPIVTEKDGAFVVTFEAAKKEAP